MHDGEVAGSGQPERVDYLSLFRGQSFDGEKSVLEMAISQAVGVAFGRFDIQQIMAEHANLSADMVFEELPCISPMQSSPSVNAKAGEKCCADGILVGDVGHQANFGLCVLRVLQQCLDDIQINKVAQFLDASGADLDGWLGKKYFDNHLREYSISRRKAPIYWQLATPSTSYSVWCYYHRLTGDTLFRVANYYVKPKVDHEERKLNALRQESGPELSNTLRKELDNQENFVAELRAFAIELDRVIPLWNPNFNDGVKINFAPLWRLVPQHKEWQKECKKVWDKLIKGDYDWAHIAMHLWPERVVAKCRDDRSLAIAHEIECEFWYEDDKGKWQKLQASNERVEELISERSSTSVKAALKDLLDAPGSAASHSLPKRKTKA